MPPFRLLAATAALSLSLTGCSIAAETAAAPPVAAMSAKCNETTADPATARPPALASTTSSWFGRGDLWVGLPDYPAVAEGDSLVLKFPLVTLSGGRPTDELGPPVVTAVRSGSNAPGEATGLIGGMAKAFGTGQLSFWPATVTFPEAGCWTVTGTVAATTVAFVVDVASR